jgi:hypothetical protein
VLHVTEGEREKKECINTEKLRGEMANGLWLSREKAYKQALSRLTD